MVQSKWLTSLLTLVVLSVSQSASAGWPFFSDGGPKRGTPEYYQYRAADPPGARQKFLYGKVWPVSPRPVGPSQTFAHKYHTAHYWPHPYQCLDRQSVRTVVEMQVANGWKTGTTFYSYHFDEKTNELNSAGREHLRWLVHYAPERFRQAYVSNGTTPEASTARLMAVEREIANATGGTQTIAVSPTYVEPLGRPAMEVQQILTGARDAALPPRIEYQSANSGGGAGG